MRSVDNSCDTMPIPSVVVSLGTGIQPSEDVNTSHFDISMPANIFDIVTKVPKVKTLINLLIDQVRYKTLTTFNMWLPLGLVFISFHFQATQTEGQVVSALLNCYLGLQSVI